jgi:hypothetical protein
LTPGQRKLALSAHLACSVGWIGAVLAYLVLDLTVAAGEDPAIVRPAWIAMGILTARVIVPLAVASLVTGLVMAFGTKWGLFRYWWVLISFVLTVFATVVLASEAGVIARMAAIASDPATSDEHLLALPATLPHSVGGLLVLLLVQVLNVYKPQGLTRYGWRRQQEERQRRDHRRRAAPAPSPCSPLSSARNRPGR